MKDGENNATWAAWAPEEETSCQPGEYLDAKDDT
jgi:hypothetical protein